MKKWLILSMCFASMSIFAQEKEVKEFTKIELGMPYKIELIQSKTNKVDAGSKTDKLEISVSGGILEIEQGTAGVFDEPIKVYFTKLNSLEVSGAGEFFTSPNSVIETEKLEVESSGASKLNLNIKVTDFKLELAGACKATIKGTAQNAEVEIAGASKYYASDLKTEETKIEGAGATYFNVFANKSLNVEAAGATKGVYNGNPTTKNINVAGISNVVDGSTGEQLKDERNGEDGDTTKIRIGNRKVLIYEDGKELAIEQKDAGDEDKKKSSKKKPLKEVYSGFEMGMNSFTDNQMNFTMPINYNFLETKINKSWFYGINFLEGDLILIKNNLALTSGLGMEFQTFEFNTNRILTPNARAVSADSNQKALNRNRLYNFNFNVPLLVKFAPRTAKGRNGFHMAVGLIGTYKAYSHVKIESTADGYELESKMRDDYSINPFRVQATARVGYGWFRAFANYSLTPYFKKDSGVAGQENPDIRVFSAGITLIPFQ
jgi:hypothetical protein